MSAARAHSESDDDKTVTCHLKCQVPSVCYNIVQFLNGSCVKRSHRDRDLQRVMDSSDTEGLLEEGQQKNTYNDTDLGLGVYTTAYVLIRNATPEMYSPDPFRNSDLWKMWLTVTFILCSQMLALLMLLFFNCPVVDEASFFVDCSNHTHVVQLLELGQISHASQCASVGAFGFEADSYGRHVVFRRATIEFYYYENTFGQACGTSLSTVALQIVCCLWVHAQVYFTDIRSIIMLMRYTDFSYWFLHAKGQTPQNQWAILIPLASFMVSVLILCLSYSIICGFGNAFDIVSSSVGFTFIANISEFFNYDLLSYYKKLPVPNERRDATSGMLVCYLYPDYDPTNAVWEGERVEGTWYILEDDQDSGFLTDFKFRYRKGDYVEHSVPKIFAIRLLSTVLPLLTLFVNYSLIGASNTKLSFL